MTPLERIRIEKAAADCGFEREPVLSDNGQLELRSALFPEVLSVSSLGASGFKVSALNPAMLGSTSCTEVAVENVAKLYAVLQYASAFARVMPNRVADEFRAKTQNLPRTTQAERTVVQRVGQDIFRNALMDYWQGRCCVTGLSVPSLLRASHIKPWALCETDEERLDVFNGLLLSPHLDALFDGGWISFSNQGTLIMSKELPASAKTQLGIAITWRIEGLKAAHEPYLGFHRRVVFRSGKQPSGIF